jgi:hypothetical protein
VWSEAERAGVDQEGGPDQIQARRARCCLTIVIKLGRRAREIGGGPAQAKRGTDGQGRICVPNQVTARASGQFGERRPDPSHGGRASEDVEGLTEVVTTFIVGARACSRYSTAWRTRLARRKRRSRLPGLPPRSPPRSPAATNVRQVEELLGALGLKLGAEQIAALDKASA